MIKIPFEQVGHASDGDELKDGNFVESANHLMSRLFNESRMYTYPEEMIDDESSIHQKSQADVWCPGNRLSLGSKRSSKSLTPAHKTSKLEFRLRMSSEGFFSCDTPPAACMSVISRLYPICEYVYL